MRLAPLPSGRFPADLARVGPITALCTDCTEERPIGAPGGGHLINNQDGCRWWVTPYAALIGCRSNCVQKHFGLRPFEIKNELRGSSMICLWDLACRCQATIPRYTCMPIHFQLYMDDVTMVYSMLDEWMNQWTGGWLMRNKWWMDGLWIEDRWMMNKWMGV